MYSSVEGWKVRLARTAFTREAQRAAEEEGINFQYPTLNIQYPSGGKRNSRLSRRGAEELALGGGAGRMPGGGTNRKGQECPFSEGRKSISTAWKFRIFNRRCRRWTQMEPPGESPKLLCALFCGNPKRKPSWPQKTQKDTKTNCLLSPDRNP
jgi:hypothetical protein